MEHLFVKICGITRAEDALSAVEAGADAIGFNFYQGSKRFISPGAAAAIAATMHGKTAKVGVFVNPTVDEVRAVLREVGLDVLQFSGEEKPSLLAEFPTPVYKVIHVRGSSSLAQMDDYKATAYLLDTFVPGEFGGTGVPFDWKLAKDGGAGRKIIIAGGLTPENVEQAVRAAAPFGVDVSGGVEVRPGVKDPTKMEQFILRARRAVNSNVDKSNARH